MRNNLIRSTNSAGDSGVELAVTYQLDGIQDWSYCKPGHRQVRAVLTTFSQFLLFIVIFSFVFFQFCPLYVFV